MKTFAILDSNPKMPPWYVNHFLVPNAVLWYAKFQEHKLIYIDAKGPNIHLRIKMLHIQDFLITNENVLILVQMY
jgi:hypothetical protein